MKKIAVIALITSTVIIAGCGKTGQDMSFQDAYGVLKSHNIFANKDYQTPDVTKVLHDNTSIDFSLHASEGFVATGVLKSEGSYNLPSVNGGGAMNLYVDTEAFEPSFGSNVKLTGDILFVEDSGKIYGKINGFSLTPEKEAGNVEGGVINALVNTISKKWITLSDGSEKTSLVPYRKNIIEFFHQFNLGRNKYSLFKEIGKTEIDGYTAYKIGWDEDGVKGFVQHILQDAKNIGTPIAFDGSTMDEAIQGIISSPLEGYLIIKSSDEVTLRIDSVSTQDSGKIGFVYNKDGLDLILKDTDNTIIATGNVMAQGKELAFSLTVPTNHVNIVGYTENNQDIAVVTVKNDEFILHARIGGTTNSVDTYSPIVITGSTAIKQIIEGFSMLYQGAEDKSTSTR